MSFRSDLSPDQKMALIVAGWVLVLGATALTLYLLTPPAPAPVPVVPQAVGDVAAPDQSAPRVFTAPGAPLPTSAAPGVASTPQTFTAPGVQPQSGPKQPLPLAPPRIAGNGAPGASAPPASPGAPLPFLPPPPNNRPALPTSSPPPVNAEAQRAFDEGQTALRAGDKAKAAAAFARAVQLAPANLPSRLNLASAYLDLKQPARAVPHLRAVVERQPNNAAVQFTLARALLADKKLGEALPHLKKTVQLEPRERQAQALLAQVLLDTRQPQQAYQQWSTLAQKNPKDVEAQLQAATIANDVLKKPAQAEKWLRRAVATSPRDPQPALMLGQLLLARRDARGAAAVLTKAAQSNPDNFAVYPLLADARTAAGDARGAATALQSALAKLPTGHSDAQKREIRATEGALRLALGRTLGASKQPQQARVEFDKAAQLLPRDPQPRALGAVAALQLKDTTGAIAELQSALALDPKRSNDRKTLAQLLADTKNWQEADAQFALYDQNKPGDAEALLQWAGVAGQLKNWKRQAQVLKKAVKVAPKNAAAWTQLALAQRESGDKKGALASFQQLNRIKPNDADVLYETARVQSDLGDNAAAYTTFKTVVRARPQAVAAYAALLKAADAAGENAGARQFLVGELAKKENPAAMRQILDFYGTKNQNEQARAFLSDLVARAPKQDAARTALEAMKGATAAPASAPSPTKTPAIKLAAAPTPQPTATTAAQPATQPATGPTLAPPIAPHKAVEHSADAARIPLVPTQPTP